MCWRERIGAGQNPDSPSHEAEQFSFSPCKAGSSLDDGVDTEAEAVFGAKSGGQELHPCWQPVALPSGLQVFENRFTGILTYAMHCLRGN